MREYTTTCIFLGFAVIVVDVLVVLLAIHISREVSIMFGQVGNGLEATRVYLVV